MILALASSLCQIYLLTLDGGWSLIENMHTIYSYKSSETLLFMKLLAQSQLKKSTRSFFWILDGDAAVSTDMMARTTLMWALLLALSLFNSTSDGLNLGGAVEKARYRLQAWASQQEHPNILLVDGNNVRGATNFQWSQPQLLWRLKQFSHARMGSVIVVVWDHGMERQACLYDSTVAVVFAGLGETADDVIVQEANKLADKRKDWSAVGVITNDSELQNRVRRKAAERQDNSRSPLLMDSTRFAAMLNETEYDVAAESSSAAHHVSIAAAVSEAECRLVRHAALRRQRHHPRRKQTWHRVVLSEALRSALLARENDMVSDPYSDDFLLLKDYVEELKSRGYGGTLTDEVLNTDLIGGPTRLDRRQRRQLQSYVKALRNGQLDSNFSPQPYQPPSCANIAYWESQRLRRRHRADKKQQAKSTTAND